MRSLNSIGALAASLLASSSFASIAQVDLFSYSIQTWSPGGGGRHGAPLAAGILAVSDAQDFSAAGPTGTLGTSDFIDPIENNNTTRSNRTEPRSAPGEDADAWTATHLGGNWSFGLDGKQITGTIGTGAWTPPSLRTYARLSAASISALDAWAASGGSTLSLELDTVPAGEVFIGFFHASDNRFVRFGKFGDPMGAGHITLTGLTAPTAGTQLWLSMRSPATSLNFGDAKSAVSVVDLYDMSISAYQVPAPGAAALIGLAGLVARRRRG